jgi:hypothetical protein
VLLLHLHLLLLLLLHQQTKTAQRQRRSHLLSFASLPLRPSSVRARGLAGPVHLHEQAAVDRRQRPPRVTERAPCPGGQAQNSRHEAGRQIRHSDTMHTSDTNTT